MHPVLSKLSFVFQDYLVGPIVTLFTRAKIQR